jgi:hypothetical protein
MSGSPASRSVSGSFSPPASDIPHNSFSDVVARLGSFRRLGAILYIHPVSMKSL